MECHYLYLTIHPSHTCKVLYAPQVQFVTLSLLCGAGKHYLLLFIIIAHYFNEYFENILEFPDSLSGLTVFSSLQLLL